jgi:hypothetical protein
MTSVRHLDVEADQSLDPTATRLAFERRHSDIRRRIVSRHLVPVAVAQFWPAKSP